MLLLFLCQKSVAVALVLPDPGRQNTAKFRILKIIYWMKYSTFHCVNQGAVLL